MPKQAGIDEESVTAAREDSLGLPLGSLRSWLGFQLVAGRFFALRGLFVAWGRVLDFFWLIQLEGYCPWRAYAS